MFRIKLLAKWFRVIECCTGPTRCSILQLWGRTLDRIRSGFSELGWSNLSYSATVILLKFNTTRVVVLRNFLLSNWNIQELINLSVVVWFCNSDWAFCRTNLQIHTSTSLKLWMRHDCWYCPTFRDKLDQFSGICNRYTYLPATTIQASRIASTCNVSKA